MGKYLLSVFIIFLFLTMQVNAQTKMPLYDEKGDSPEVPRVSALEAYTKYKAGKAILLHAGGEGYHNRHIMGALNFDKYNDKMLLKLPKQGIEIFAYCY